jgi:hypothetical protein
MPNINQFVLLHELSHIGTDSIGETTEFWENFKYLISVVVAYDAHLPINYGELNIAFHNLNIDSNPFYVSQIGDAYKHNNNSGDQKGAENFMSGCCEKF